MRHSIRTGKAAFSAAMNPNLTDSPSRRRPSLFLGCRAPSAASDSRAAAGPTPPAPQGRLRQVQFPRYRFFFNDTPPTEIYCLSLHDALPNVGLIDAQTTQRL